MSWRYRRRSEGGSGGRRGHSAMEHWEPTKEVKDWARLIRRRADRFEAEAQIDEIREDSD